MIPYAYDMCVLLFLKNFIILMILDNNINKIFKSIIQILIYYPDYLLKLKPRDVLKTKVIVQDYDIPNY